MAQGIYALPYMAKGLLPGCYAGRQLSDGRWEVVAPDDVSAIVASLDGDRTTISALRGVGGGQSAGCSD